MSKSFLHIKKRELILKLIHLQWDMHACFILMNKYFLLDGTIINNKTWETTEPSLEIWTSKMLEEYDARVGDLVMWHFEAWRWPWLLHIWIDQGSWSDKWIYYGHLSANWLRCWKAIFSEFCLMLYLGPDPVTWSIQGASVLAEFLVFQSWNHHSEMTPSVKLVSPSHYSSININLLLYHQLHQ